MTTAAEETKLTITAEENQLKANGEDLAYVSVEITDNAGIRKMLSDRKITISVSGAGALAAVGSAACRTEESYLSNSFTTYNGKMIAIIRTGKEAGTLIVNASAEGMEPVSITIQVK